MSDYISEWIAMQGLPPNDCPLCAVSEALVGRLMADLLETRLQVADGPRARVLELERTVEKLNATIARLNDRLCNGRKAS